MFEWGLVDSEILILFLADCQYALGIVVLGICWLDMTVFRLAVGFGENC